MANFYRKHGFEYWTTHAHSYDGIADYELDNMLNGNWLLAKAMKTKKGTFELWKRKIDG